MFDQEISQHPFSLLDADSQKRLQDSVDLAYYEQGDMILDANSPSDHVFVVHKGVVEELDLQAPDSQSRIGIYAAGDLFGAIAVLNGRSRYRFVAEQQTLCYLIPARLFLSLCEHNAPFNDHFRQRLANKTQRLAERREGGVTMAGFMLARMSECMRDPLIMPATNTIRDATIALKQHGVDSVLVKLDHQYGIATKTDLLSALVLDGKSDSTALADIAETGLITAEPGDYLFEGLVSMTRNRVARVVVMENSVPVGVLELTDVLSFFSSRSYVVGLEIEKADNLDALTRASTRLPELVEALMAQGVKIRFAMDLLAALNGRIMQKSWEFVIPQVQAGQHCLIVMGSEGRGEQIMKTDQDNGVILADNTNWPDQQDDLMRFTNTLLNLGYPPCKGNVMVSNPDWTGTLNTWRERINGWARNNDTLQLAIVTDLHAGAGNIKLARNLRQHLFATCSNNQLLMSHFTRPVLQFATPLNLFGSLKKPQHGINIKKAGIFPIVHGIRALALEQRIEETSTFARMQKLVDAGQLEASTADDLEEALSLFSELRLQQQLRRAAGQDHDLKDNHIVVQRLSSLERDLLRDALHLVNEFKQRLSRHFHLEYQA